jgi:hypothetical protein
MAHDVNNFHYLDGLGAAYWSSIARGQRPTAVRVGRMGATIDFASDTDGFVIQNGGMYNPQPTKMLPGSYFRFFDTISHNRFGTAAFTGGGWWVAYECYLKIAEWAEAYDLSLAKAASRLLVIPAEWGDCGYVGKARLTTPMKAFVGKGKPATGSVSPDSAERASGKVPIQMAVTHLDIKQYLVPGTRALLGQVFTVVGTEQVLHNRRPLPFLTP